MRKDALMDQLAYGSGRESRIGVIDVGSNSIRLVVYDALKRVPLPLYNEKAFCSLGKGLSQTNRLNPEGVKMARKAIARLLAAAKLNRVTELHIIATAAIRDADDGKAFVKEIERTHHIKIDVISGKKEAKYAALGIVSGHYQPKGLVADLGGGSLELTLLEEQDILHHSSQPIGSLQLLDRGKGKPALMQDLMEQYLNQIDWLAELAGKQTKQLYAVGGSFRAIAKSHRIETDYPLELLHNYTVKTKELLPYLEELIEADEARLEKLPISIKRRQQIPVAARLLKELLSRSNAKRVIFSTSGIREGLLFSQLSPYIRQEDPLLASCDMLRNNQMGQARYARELFEWMSPLFRDESDDERRVRMAACMLNHQALTIQSANRPAWAYHHILHSSIRGMEHEERVMLAASVYHRYRSIMKDSFGSYQLLDAYQASWARLVGTAMRLAYTLSGGSPGNLPQTQLRLEKDRPQLRLSPPLKPLQGETLDKRKEVLSESYLQFVRSQLKRVA
jgi:exopolyphosphatase/guanosine-5'-triphosphate,3'-diphosphate pyrophosphatase